MANIENKRRESRHICFSKTKISLRLNEALCNNCVSLSCSNEQIFVDVHLRMNVRFPQPLVTLRHKAIPCWVFLRTNKQEYSVQIFDERLKTSKSEGLSWPRCNTYDQTSFYIAKFLEMHIGTFN